MTYAWFNIGDGREVYRRVPEPKGKRSDLPSPMLSLDTMEAVQHPCDGRLYDSKSAFRRVTKAHGCVELGNDAQRMAEREKPKPDRRSIRDAVRKAANRVKNG